MKKRYFIFIFPTLLFILFQLRVTAQAPAKMSYQAVIRDENNNLVVNSEIGIQISILQASETGAVIYRETHQPVSNENGLVTLEIGNGINTIGHFESIDWAIGPFFLHTEADPTGGFSYTISGTSQFLSVPFAFHAKTAENISGANTIIDSILSNYLTGNITAADTSKWNNKMDSLTGNESVFQGWDKNSIDDFSGNYNDLKGKPTQISQFTNDAGYLNTESDPVFNGSVAAGITQADTSAWNAASIGSFAETDPAFTAWNKSSGISIVKSQVTDLSFDVFEKELTDNENNIDVGFNLVSTSEIFINGTALPSGEWSGIGSQILNFSIQTKLYDKLKVKK
ncbi:MAG: hypothetical protein JW833_14625 [Prolixibacteraceae bacterium]|nr:hypothetical protein [Prolixibacteraceae bacterium]